MAAPVSIDMAVYRMKAYSGLLKESVTEGQQDIGRDIAVLVEWIEYARPLLGAVTAEAQAVNPFSRHGIQQQHQGFDFNTAADPKPKSPDDDPDDDPDMPHEPTDKPSEGPVEAKPPA